MCNCISTTVWDLGTQICEILVITTCICRFSPLKCMFSVICRWTQEDFLCLYFCAIQVLCWVQMWAHLEQMLYGELRTLSFLILIIALLWEAFCQTPIINLLTPISNFFGWIIVICKSIFRAVTSSLSDRGLVGEAIVSGPAVLNSSTGISFCQSGSQALDGVLACRDRTGVHDIILCHFYPTSALVPPIDYLLNWKFQIRPMMTQ